ncbi:MAG: hypothetical protein FD550_000482 [Pelagibacterales bacterium]|nr:hypothetical protein [Pelagibacterales bacterium]
MLFKFLSTAETSLHKSKSFWSTFKNAYLKGKNLKKFWLNLDKKNLSPELIEITELFINSNSYNLISKFWRHCLINHYNHIANVDKNIDPLHAILKSDYSGFTFLDEYSVNEALKIDYQKIKFEIDIFKKHKDLSNLQSLQYNIVLLMLYENIKNKKIFKYYNDIKLDIYIDYNPCLNIDNKILTQQMLISLLEYEKIFSLIDESNTEPKILELGGGYGRTANMILSLKPKAKYVIADLAPTIYFSKKLLSNSFKDRKIKSGFKIDSSKEMMKAFNENDILFIFPHQLNLFDKKTFDISLSIGNLCEMEKKQIKHYMKIYEEISHSLYFKVWEISGLPYSFNQYYSVHNSKDYKIKDNWKEHFKDRCFMPSNQFELGYKF